MTRQLGTFGQGLATASRLAACFPRDIPREEAQSIIDSPDFLREFLAGIGPAFKTYRASVPADNVEFDLTLDGDKVDPIGMVRNDSYSNPDEWEFDGKRIPGIHTSRFKLVSIGCCENFDEVLRKLKECGEVQEGQWREAFKRKFPRPARNDLIGFADASWVNPLGYRNFPYLAGDGGAWDSYFRMVGSGFNDCWRWLVCVSPCTRV